MDRESAHGVSSPSSSSSGPKNSCSSSNKNNSNTGIGTAELAAAIVGSSVVTAGLMAFGAMAAPTFRRHRAQMTAIDEWSKVASVPLERMKAIKASFLEEARAGLAGKPSSLMMLPSMVDVLPSGDEQGEYFAIDIGGTNYRVTYARLSPETGRLDALEMRDSAIPDWAYLAPAPELFDLLAQAVVSLGRDLGVLDKEGESAKDDNDEKNENDDVERKETEKKPLTVGFCFSFPCDQTALDAGKLLKLTKRFQNEGAVGRDPVVMLREALARAGQPGARVAALLNDSVGTLAGGRYSDPAVAVGVILGTGTNAAYVESASNVPKIPAEISSRLRGGRVVVNTEWGNFSSSALPTLAADEALDAASEHPREQLLEKQVSGMYMGECARRLLLELVEKHGLFCGVFCDGGRGGGGGGQQGETTAATTSSSTPTSPTSTSTSIPEGLKSPGAFSTADVSACDTDTTLTLSNVQRVLTKVLGKGQASKCSYLERRVVRAVCSLVARRSARLLAAAVASLLQLVEDAGESVSGVPRGGRVAVAVDGGVFEHYAKYRETCRRGLSEALGVPLSRVDGRVALRRVRDASSMGAAFLAAAADHHRLGLSASEEVGEETRRSAAAGPVPAVA